MCRHVLPCAQAAAPWLDPTALSTVNITEYIRAAQPANAASQLQVMQALLGSNSSPSSPYTLTNTSSLVHDTLATSTLLSPRVTIPPALVNALYALQDGGGSLGGGPASATHGAGHTNTRQTHSSRTSGVQPTVPQLQGVGVEEAILAQAATMLSRAGLTPAGHQQHQQHQQAAAPAPHSPSIFQVPAGGLTSATAASNVLPAVTAHDQDAPPILQQPPFKPSPAQGPQPQQLPQQGSKPSRLSIEVVKQDEGTGLDPELLVMGRSTCSTGSEMAGDSALFHSALTEAELEELEREVAVSRSQVPDAMPPQGRQGEAGTDSQNWGEVDILLLRELGMSASTFPHPSAAPSVVAGSVPGRRKSPRPSQMSTHVPNQQASPLAQQLLIGRASNPSQSVGGVGPVAATAAGPTVSQHAPFISRDPTFQFLLAGQREGGPGGAAAPAASAQQASRGALILDDGGARRGAGLEGGAARGASGTGTQGTGAGTSLLRPPRMGASVKSVAFAGIEPMSGPPASTGAGSLGVSSGGSSILLASPTTSAAALKGGWAASPPGTTAWPPQSKPGASSEGGGEGMGASAPASPSLPSPWRGTAHALPASQTPAHAAAPAPSRGLRRSAIVLPGARSSGRHAGSPAGDQQ